MKCNVYSLLNHAAGELEDENGESVAGYGFALRELANNLRELKERTDKGDMAAVAEFFTVYVVP
jgi:hypothetical protein